MAISIPPAREPYLGIEVPSAEARVLLSSVAGWLGANEPVLALVATVKAVPSLTHVVVTNRRVIGFETSELAQRGLAVEAQFSAVRSVETRKTYQQRSFLTVIDDNGDEVDFGDVHGQDAPAVLQIAQDAITAARAAGSPPVVAAAPAAPASLAPGPVAAPSQSGPVPLAEPMAWRYNPPPTWPAPPPGWVPPPGWRPDPSWPPPPPGWSLWVPQVSSAEWSTGAPMETDARPAPVASAVGATVPSAQPRLRDDVQAAASRANLNIGSREVQSLVARLRADERLLHVTSGQCGAGSGLVALTDRRLLFVKHGLIRKAIEEFPLNKITTVQWKDGWLLGKITIFASGNRVEMTTASKECGKAIADVIQEQLIGWQYRAPSNTAPNGPGARHMPSVSGQRTEPTKPENAALEQPVSTSTGRVVPQEMIEAASRCAQSGRDVGKMTRGRGSAHILKVAGTQRRKAVIIPIARRYRQQHAVRLAQSAGDEVLPNQPTAAAVVLRDPSNQHDRDAVCVFIDGVHVGFLAKDDAKAWQPTLVECEKRGITLVGVARFIGEDGWGLRVQLRDNLSGFEGLVTAAKKARQAKLNGDGPPQQLDSTRLAEVMSALTVDDDRPPTTKRAAGLLVKRVRRALDAIYGHAAALKEQGKSSAAEELLDQTSDLDSLLDDLLEAEDAEQREEVTWDIAGEAALLAKAVRASVSKEPNP